MSVMQALQTGVRQFGKIAVKESPSILTGVSLVGLVTTTVLGITATPKALYLLNEEENYREENKDCMEPMTNVDKAKLIWKCYLPTVAVGLATAGCIVGANYIHLRRTAALLTIYELTENTLKEYQKKVIDIIGEKKEEKVRDEIAQDRLNSNPLSEASPVIMTGNGQSLFYESLSGRYFKSDMESVRKAQNDFNEQLLGRDVSKTVDEWYDYLNLEFTEIGKDMGWDQEHGILDIHYSAKIADGIPCIVIEYRTLPRKL